MIYGILTKGEKINSRTFQGPLFKFSDWCLDAMPIHPFVYCQKRLNLFIIISIERQHCCNMWVPTYFFHNTKCFYLRTWHLAVVHSFYILSQLGQQIYSAPIDRSVFSPSCL